MRFKSVFGSIVMVLLGCVGAQAADGDRWQETQQGRKFWFRVVSESDATVAYSTTGKDQPQTEDFNYLGGRVAHNGKTYTAVAVDENAFRGNVKLTAVRFDATVASIGATAFYNCPMLEKVVLPDQLASIGEGAFAGCVRLGNFELPASVSSIGDGAFTLCSSITAFEVAADNKTFVARDGVLYRGTKLLQYPLAKSVTRYAIPYGTTAIGAEAFYGSTKLKELHVPGTVRAVGDFFAAKCKVLTDVYLHWNLETMPKTLYQNFSRWDGDDGLLTLHVPVGWSYLYTGAQFSNFGKVVEWDAELPDEWCGQKVKYSEYAHITRNVGRGRVTYDPDTRTFHLDGAKVEYGEKGKSIIAFHDEDVIDCNGSIGVTGTNNLAVGVKDGTSVQSMSALDLTGTVTVFSENDNGTGHPRLDIDVNEDYGMCIKMHAKSELEWRDVDFTFTCRAYHTKDYNPHAIAYPASTESAAEGTFSVLVEGCSGTMDAPYSVMNGLKSFHTDAQVVQPEGGIEVSGREHGQLVQKGTSAAVKHLELLFNNGQPTFDKKMLTRGEQTLPNSTGTIVWDPDRNVLTMKSLNAKGDYGFFFPENTSIVVEGACKLTSTRNAFTSPEEIIATGKGSLEIISGANGFQVSSLELQEGTYTVTALGNAICGYSEKNKGWAAIGTETTLKNVMGKYSNTPVVANMRFVTDNSSAASIITNNPENQYYIQEAYYFDDEQGTLVAALDGQPVKDEVHYKKGTTLGYERYPLSVAGIPVSNLNKFHITKGVTYLNADKLLMLNNCHIEIPTQLSNARGIFVEPNFGERLLIWVKGDCHIGYSGTASNHQSIYINGQTHVILSGVSDNVTLGGTVVEKYDKLTLDNDREKTMSIALINGARLDIENLNVEATAPVCDLSDNCMLILYHADLSVMPRSGGYAPLYMKKFQCFYANPKNKNLKFDEEKSIFVDTTNPSARFSAYLEINRRHPNIWIGGRQITAPYIYDGQTPKAGYCHFDFRFNEFTFNNFRCVTDNGPALLYKIENNMSDENYYSPVFHFKGTNTLAGSSAGIMVGINYDTEYEAYPSTEFVMDSEGASATLNINATNGHAIYFTTPDWSQLAFEDLDITLKGQGAIGASGNAMEIYLENCNLSAYNTSDGTDSPTGAPVPTIGYFDEFELSDCSFTQAGVHYDSSLGCVADASGAPITGTVLIRRDSESGTSEQPYGQTLDVVLRDRMSSSEMSTLEQAGLFLVERHLDVNGYMGNPTTRYNTYYRKSDHKELFSAKEVFDGNTTYYLAADVETKDIIHIDITASDRDMVNIMYGADVTDLLSHYDHVRLLFAVPNAIEGVTVARPGTDSTFYMLDGRRTQGLPKKPGIYVHDGKKVLLR